MVDSFKHLTGIDARKFKRKATGNTTRSNETEELGEQTEAAPGGAIIGSDFHVGQNDFHEYTFSRSFVHYLTAVGGEQGHREIRDGPSAAYGKFICPGWRFIPYLILNKYLNPRDMEMIAWSGGIFRFKRGKVIVSNVVGLQDGVTTQAGSVDITTMPSAMAYYTCQHNKGMLPPCPYDMGDLNYYGRNNFPDTREQGTLPELKFGITQNWGGRALGSLSAAGIDVATLGQAAFDPIAMEIMNTDQWKIYHCGTPPIHTSWQGSPHWFQMGTDQHLFMEDSLGGRAEWEQVMNCPAHGLGPWSKWAKFKPYATYGDGGPGNGNYGQNQIGAQHSSVIEQVIRTDDNVPGASDTELRTQQEGTSLSIKSKRDRTIGGTLLEEGKMPITGKVARRNTPMSIEQKGCDWINGLPYNTSRPYFLMKPVPFLQSNDKVHKYCFSMTVNYNCTIEVKRTQFRYNTSHCFVDKWLKGTPCIMPTGYNAMGMSAAPYGGAPYY